MMAVVRRFNTYLLLLAVVSCASCKTSGQRSRDKAISTFRLHLEGSQGGTDSTAAIEIAGAQLFVNNAPFLDETSVTNAAVVDTRDGGFAMRIQYNRHGTFVLEAVTTANRGRHFAIFSQFGPGKLEQNRWLGAPYISASLSSGVLLFTPNSTRAEAEQVVQGLNNVARKLKKKHAS